MSVLSKLQKRSGTGGGFKGFLYEIQLIFLFVIRALLNDIQYHIVTNVQGFGNFDDIVAECILKDGTKRLICLQAKHKENVENYKIDLNKLKGKNINVNTGKCENDKRFHIKKLYDELKKETESINNVEITDFLIYTNVGIDNYDTDIKWKHLNENDNIVFKLFDSSGDINCVRKFNENDNLDILKDINNDLKFLSQTIVFSNQSNQDSIKKLIINDLKQLIKNEDMTYIENMYRILFIQIESWYKKNEINPLTNNAVTKLIEIAKEEIYYLTLPQDHRLLSKNIDFTDENIEKIKKKITENRILSINTGNSTTLLTEMKVHQALKTSEQLQNIKIFHIYLQHLNRILNLFKDSNSIIIVVIEEECDSTMYEKELKTLQEVLQVTLSNRAVFILTNEEDMSCCNNHVYEDKFQFNYFVKSTQDYILQKTISFQGEHLKLCEIINKNIYDIIDCNTALKIITEENFRIGTKINKLDSETESYYIDRLFNEIKIKETIFEDIKSNDIYFIINESENELHFKTYHVIYPNINSKIIIYNANKEAIDNKFEKISKHILQAHGIENNIHLLHYSNFELLWIKSIGSISKLLYYVEDLYVQNCINQDQLVKNNQNKKVNIIADKAGMGKTTVLKKISLKLKKKYPLCWVLFFDMNSREFTKHLHKITQSENYTKDSILDTIVRFLDIETNFEKRLFQYCFKKGNVIICFDGFDEISSTYEHLILSLFSMLDTIKQIWISSRKTIQFSLQNKLNTIAYTMKALDTEFQLKFLEKFYKFHLKRTIDKHTLNSTHLTQFCKSLLQTVINISYNLKETMGIPLLIKMIAVLNLTNIKNFQLSKKQKVTTEIELGNLSDIYDKFFTWHLERFAIEKEHRALHDHSYVTKSDDMKNTLFKSHQLLAIHSLLAEYDMKFILTKTEIKQLNIILENPDSIEKYGIIDNIQDRIIKFVHYSFAEQLVAKYLVNKIDLVNSADTCEHINFIGIVENILSNTKWSMIRKFLECNNFKNPFKKWPFLLYSSDQWERINIKPCIYIAAEEGNKKIAQFILESAYGVADLITSDKHNALYIAIQNNDIEMIKLFSKHVNFSVIVNNPLNKEYSNYLSLSAKHCDENVLCMLLEYGAEINAQPPRHSHTLKTQTTSVSQTSTQYYNALCTAATVGKIKNINILLKHKANINSRTLKGESALMLAANIGSLDIVRALIKNGANMYDKNQLEETVLMYVSKEILRCASQINEMWSYPEDNINCHNYNNTIEMQEKKLTVACEILTLGAKIHERSKDGYTALHFAVANKHYKLVKLLTDHGANIHEKNEFGVTPLQLAAYDLDILKLFLEMDANIYKNINEIDKDGNTLLHIAAQTGNFDSIQIVLEYGAEINMKNKNAYSALHLATEEDKTNCVSLLLKKGANIKSKTEDGSTALLLACKYRCTSIETVNELLKYGAHIHHTNNNGFDSLFLAIRSRNWEIVDILLKKGANIDKFYIYNSLDETYSDVTTVSTSQNDYSEGNNLLALCLKSFDTTGVQILLSNGIDVNVKDKEGRSALILAILHQNLKIIKSLLKHGAILNEKTKSGSTALHYASQYCKNNVLNFLLSNGASIHDKDEEGNSAFLLAAKHNKWDNAFLLLNNGAYINDLDKNNDSAILFAAKQQNWDIVFFLQNHGANINQINKNYFAVLTYASQKFKKISLVKSLINSGAQLKNNEHFKSIILSLMYIKNKWSFILYYLNKGANINETDNNGRCLLHYAFLERNISIIYSLLERGADIHLKTNDGCNAILLASMYGYWDIFNRLVKLGANLDCNNDFGGTAILYAAQNKKWEIVLNLIKLGARIDSSFIGGNEIGMNVFLYAVQAGKLNILKIYQKNGDYINSIGPNGCSALMYAIRNKHYDIIKFLISNGAEFNMKLNDGTSVFRLALYHGMYDLIDTFLEEGLSLNERDKNGNTAIMALITHFYFIENSLAHIKFLLKKGINIHDQFEDSEKNKTILLRAASLNYWDIVSILVLHDANIHDVNEDGNNVLLYAAYSYQMEMIEKLISKSANLNHKNNEGKSVILIFSEHRKFKYVLRLLELGANINDKSKDNNTVLTSAVKYGCIDTVCILIEKGADVNQSGMNGETPIIIASKYGHTEVGWKMFNFLLSKGANVNNKCERGFSVLHYIVITCDIEKISFCLKLGLNMNERNCEGETPLIYAATFVSRFRNNQQDLWNSLLFLLNNNADINMSNDKGEAFLHKILQNKDLERVKILVEKYGADVNKKNSKLNNALLHALKNEEWFPNDKLIEYLIDYTTNINDINEDGDNALILSVRTGRLNIVKNLISKGANIHQKNNEGNTAIIIAGKSVRMVELLLNGNANINDKDNNGNTVLLHSCLKGNTDTVKALLKFGGYIIDQNQSPCFNKEKYKNKKFKFDINVKNNDGNTALHLSSSNDHLEITELLINAGALLDLQNNSGYTPVHLNSSNFLCYEALCFKLLILKGADFTIPNFKGYNQSLRYVYYLYRHLAQLEIARY